MGTPAESGPGAWGDPVLTWMAEGDSVVVGEHTTFTLTRFRNDRVTVRADGPDARLFVVIPLGRGRPFPVGGVSVHVRYIGKRPKRGRVAALGFVTGPLGVRRSEMPRYSQIAPGRHGRAAS